MSVEKIQQLVPKLRGHWERFRRHFRTKTRDTSEHALAYMQGQMTMETDRNFAGIANRMESADGQALQHFISQSSWAEDGLLDALKDEGVGCIAFSPLAQGLLTDKYLGGIPQGSRASKAHGFLKPAHLMSCRKLKTS